jgi:hypothetical protein
MSPTAIATIPSARCQGCWRRRFRIPTAITATPMNVRTDTPSFDPALQRNVDAIIGESQHRCNRRTAALHLTAILRCWIMRRSHAESASLTFTPSGYRRQVRHQATTGVDVYPFLPGSQG